MSNELSLPLIYEGTLGRYRQQVGYELLGDGAMQIETTTNDEGRTTVITRRFTPTSEGGMRSSSQVVTLPQENILVRPSDQGPLLVVKFSQA